MPLPAEELRRAELAFHQQALEIARHAADCAHAFVAKWEDDDGELAQTLVAVARTYAAQWDVMVRNCEREIAKLSKPRPWYLRLLGA